MVFCCIDDFCRPIGGEICPKKKHYEEPGKTSRRARRRQRRRANSCVRKSSISAKESTVPDLRSRRSLSGCRKRGERVSIYLRRKKAPCRRKHGGVQEVRTGPAGPAAGKSTRRRADVPERSRTHC